MIGLGPRGWFHLERLRLCDDAVVVAVSDSSPTLREQARGSNWPVVDTPAAVLATKPLDGVLITSPPEERGDIVARALQAGLHVCVEPPFAMDPSQARQWLSLADRYQRRLSLAPWSRWDGQFETALAAVVSGRLGQVHAIRISVAEWSPLVVKAGRPAGPDVPPERQFGPHGFDQLLQLTTAEPTSISARHLPHEDGFFATIDFDNGTVAQIDFRRRTRSGQTTGWVLEGDQASYRAGRLITVSADGELADEPIVSPPAAAVSEWRAMCDVTPSPARDAERRRMWQTIALTEAITRACHRRGPIRWDEIVGS